MAIGDLVLESAGVESLALVKAATAGWDGALDAHSLVSGTRFQTWPDGLSFNGIAALLDRYHSTYTYGTDFGVESVAVPFSHLVFVSGPGAMRWRERLANDIANRMETMWKGAIDPLIGARVDFIETPDGKPDALELFFGSGVFVPPDGVSPVGKVEVQLVNGRGAPQIPTLGPANQMAPRPAAFYLGQSALAFASSLSLAPAVVDFGLPDHVMLLHPDPSLPPSRPLRLINLPLRGSQRDYAALPNPQKPGTPDQDDDVSDGFLVTYNLSQTLLVNYTADDRQSRLCRRPRPGRFEITGVVAPREGDRPSDQWWVDLDRQDIMIGSSLVPVARSVVVRSGRVLCYNRQTFAYDRKAALPYALESVAVKDGRGLQILRRRNGAFGYLLRPEKPQRVSFVQEGAQDCYVLDWADLAAAAEIGLRREGLGTLAQERGVDVLLGARGSPVAIQAPNGILYRERPDGVFERHEKAPWSPGGQIVLEPFCLTMAAEEEAK